MSGFLRFIIEGVFGLKDKTYEPPDGGIALMLAEERLIDVIAQGSNGGKCIQDTPEGMVPLNCIFSTCMNYRCEKYKRHPEYISTYWKENNKEEYLKTIEE